MHASSTDTEAFLARVVPAQGNYLTISWPGSDSKRGWPYRSYKPDQIHTAANMLRWATRKNLDAYFAVAAFNVAEITVSARGDQVIKASRVQDNIHLLRALWMDADVKRAGDKKDPATTFPDRRKAVEWLLDFTGKTGVPKPNLAVNSGYGLHFYWVLEDAVTLDVWQPQADALRAAMLAHGWTGDTGPTVDGSRLLRPPGTMNFKSGTGVPVSVLPRFTAADYPNQQIITALTPWIGAARTQRATGTHGVSATITSIGPRPAHIAGPGVALNQAAHAGLESRFLFAEIGKKCAQVKLSLASKGKGENYPIWYLGHLSLAAHTKDGKDHVHPISEGDPRYDPVVVDAAFSRAEDERDRKGLGAPTCAFYDAARPGVCGTCPYNGKIKSPLGLGVAENDLPARYKRAIVAGEPFILRYEGTQADGSWVPLLQGDVANPRLDELPTGGHRLSFLYKLAGRNYPVGANGADMNSQIAVAYFERQGVAVNRHNAALTGDFVMAWITQLRVQQTTNTDVVRPFGWNFSGGEHAGIAIAGTLYRTDGSEDAIPGGDPKVAAMYRPTGEFKHWRDAAALFEGQRPDLQALISVSFGSVLIALCGDVRGMTLNFWSTESGVGKTSAMRVGQSVWGDMRALQSMRDTPNAVMRSLSEPRILPRYWDEFKIRKDYQEDFSELVFTIPQGKERARMQADTTLREVGEWETLLALTCNRPCQDYLLSGDEGTDAGLARLLEIELPKDVVSFDPLSGQRLKLCETNHGHAGRVYAKYLATHLPQVKAQLASVLKALNSGLGVQRDERFSIIAMTCMLVGAAVAKKLKLFDFDITGVQAVLTTAFLNQREQRKTRTMVSAAGGLNTEEIINEFVYSQADFRICTTAFHTGGAGKVDVIGVLPRGNVIRLQIAQAEEMLRISRRDLFEWLRNRNIAATTIIKDLKDRLGATDQRKALGGGTGFGGGGSINVIDIPLTGKLADMIPEQIPGLRKPPADVVK